MAWSVRMVGLKEAKARMRKAAQSVKIGPLEVVKTVSESMQRQWKHYLSGPRRKSGFWGVATGSPPYVTRRSGRSASSIVGGGTVTRNGDMLRATVWSPQRHLSALDVGGPRPATYRIPTVHAQTPAGVDRNMGRSMRGVEGFELVVRRSRDGTPRAWIARVVRTSIGPRGGVHKKYALWYLIGHGGSYLRRGWTPLLNRLGVRTGTALMRRVMEKATA